MAIGSRSISSFTVHNRVKIVHGGSEYFRLMLQMIDGAKYTIHLQVYIFEDDETGKQVGDALMRAAQRGVKVYVLVDGYASRRLDSDFRERVQAAGVRFSLFEPFFRSGSFYVGRRLHHKVLVTDSAHALVGGINISDRYNDIRDSAAWLDWAVYAEGEISYKVDKFCIEIWRGSTLPREYEEVTFSAPKVEAECLVRMRRNDWVKRKTEVYRSYMEIFTTAEKQVTLMSGYFWPGQKLLRRMSAAAKRGVKIRLMLAGVSDIPIAKSAERYVYRRLFKSDIEVYEYQGNVLHGKIAVADTCFVTVGSYNVNNISAYASLELNLDIKDDDFAVTVEQKLDKILQKDCIKITEESFIKKYNFIQRMWQRFAFNLVHLIFFLFTFYFQQSAAKRMSRSLKE